jgi:hypothetical protein
LNRGFTGLSLTVIHLGIRLSQLREQASDSAKPHKHPLLVCLQVRVRFVGQFPQTIRVDQASSFRLKRLFFVREQSRLFDFLDLESQHFLEPIPVGSGPAHSLCLRSQIFPFPVHVFIPRPHRLNGSKGVHRVQLFGGDQERLLFVLTMNVNERPSQLFEDTKRTEASVEIDPVATGSGQDPPKNEFRILWTDDALRTKMSEEWMGLWKMEGGLELGFFLSRADLLRRSPPPDQQTDGINQE